MSTDATIDGQDREETGRTLYESLRMPTTRVWWTSLPEDIREEWRTLAEKGLRGVPPMTSQHQATSGTTLEVAFRSRGVGADWTPGCFVCGGEGNLHSNISGFVRSKADGEQVVAMFDHGARLDYRDYEPDWIQVKIGACKTHEPHLRSLSAATADANGHIRRDMILASCLATQAAEISALQAELQRVYAVAEHWSDESQRQAAEIQRMTGELRATDTVLDQANDNCERYDLRIKSLERALHAIVDQDSAWGEYVGLVLSGRLDADAPAASTDEAKA